MKNKKNKLFIIFIIIIIILFSSCAGSLPPNNYEMFNYQYDSMMVDVDDSGNDLKQDSISFVYEQPQQIIENNENEQNDQKFLKAKNSNQSENKLLSAQRRSTNTNGTLLYKIDTIFTIDVLSRVEARIVKQIFDSVPTYIIEMFHKSKSGKIKKDIIQVGNIMNMKLICLDKDAFEIVEVSSDNQKLENNVIAEWIWGVTPKKAGNFNLILKATIIDGDINSDKIVFDKEIYVKNKPKTNYVYTIKHEDKFTKQNENNIILDFYETKDSGDFQWGGYGAIILEIENEDDFIITKDGYYLIGDINEFKWIIKPIGKSKTLNYKIYVKNNSEKVLITENEIEISSNFWYWFNNMLDVIIPRWYYLIFTLLIPAYMWFKKKKKAE